MHSRDAAGEPPPPGSATVLPSPSSKRVPLPSILPLSRFIGGEPMKPATKVVAGFA